MTDLLRDSLEQLFVKKDILEQIIRENAYDPRIGEPKRQLLIINEEIEKREKIKSPPNLSVGLNTLNIKVKQ